MLSRDEHLVQADRFKSFLDSLPPNTPYKEWVIVLWFYISLHYVEALLMTRAAKRRKHETRFDEMRKHYETQEIQADYKLLFELSREARYDGTPFVQADIDRYRPAYERVVARMKTALNI